MSKQFVRLRELVTLLAIALAAVINSGVIVEVIMIPPLIKGGKPVCQNRWIAAMGQAVGDITKATLNKVAIMPN